MAYNEFAYFYDEFNGEADYDALYGYITDELKAHGITDGILADLGCGTGDLTLMLTQAGYDVIGIDRSEEMLSVLREKADELGLTGRLLLLKQDLLDLDLYGTIRAAVSTFDTYSHIGPQENFEKAIRKAAYFMERGGVFIFDLNTPYKHRHILHLQTDHRFNFIFDALLKLRSGLRNDCLICQCYFNMNFKTVLRYMSAHTAISYGLICFCNSECNGIDRINRYAYTAVFRVPDNRRIRLRTPCPQKHYGKAANANYYRSSRHASCIKNAAVYFTYKRRLRLGSEQSAHE